MRTFVVAVVGPIGGIIAGLLLSEIVGVVGFLLFDVPSSSGTLLSSSGSRVPSPRPSWTRESDGHPDSHPHYRQQRSKP